MRIKHFGIFKSEIKVLQWERLRNDESEQPYYLPYNKQDYLLKVDTNEASYTTRIILNDLGKTGLKKIFSIGSGIAFQEYQIKKFSDFTVVVSDYNSSVLRLKQFGIFDDALLLDAFKDPIPVDQSWIMLFPRIDTEFDDDQLSILFTKCHNLGIKHICFIPAELLSFQVIIAEIKTYVISIIKRRKRVFCGYARSLSYFKKIWGRYYNLEKKIKTDNRIFFLLSAN